MPDIGFIVAVFGVVVGLAGGLYGTWAAVHNARSDEERAALLKVAFAMWAGLFLLLIPTTLAITGFISRWVYLGLAILYVIALVPFVIWANRCVADACRMRDERSGG